MMQVANPAIFDHHSSLPPLTFHISRPGNLGSGYAGTLLVPGLSFLLTRDHDITISSSNPAEQLRCCSKRYRHCDVFSPRSNNRVVCRR